MKCTNIYFKKNLNVKIQILFIETKSTILIQVPSKANINLSNNGLHSPTKIVFRDFLTQ